MNVSDKYSGSRNELRDVFETAVLLRTDLCQHKLAMWRKWLSNDDVCRNNRFWDWVLDAAISVGLADFANIQLVHPRLSGLELKAQRGFQRPFLEFFRFVNDDHSACGAAFKRQRPVIVQDITNSPVFAH